MPDADEIVSLRLALAEAKRQRDDALASAEAAAQWREEERQEELNRLRNLFSVIRVIARRTVDDARSVEDYCGTLDRRLSSYLSVQAAVARDWQRGLDLALLISGQIHMFGLQEGDRVELVGPTTNLTSRAAVLLALAFHELAASAVLSGRLESERSGLRVNWSLAEHGQDYGLAIDWVESTHGRDADEAPQTSWTEWIEQAISHQLAGTLAIHDTPAGRSATFRLPHSAKT